MSMKVRNNDAFQPECRDALSEDDIRSRHGGRPKRDHAQDCQSIVSG